MHSFLFNNGCSSYRDINFFQSYAVQLFELPYYILVIMIANIVMSASIFCECNGGMGGVYKILFVLS